jgi:hypothetical protein
LTNQDESTQPQVDQSSTPPPGNVTPSQKGSEAEDKDSDPRSDPQGAKEVARELHWLEKFNIVGQLSLVCVGIIAACIYGFQLHTMNRQLDEMSKQYPEIKKSAEAAKVAAEAAKGGLVQSIEFFRTDERAWVVIGKIEKILTVPADPPFGSIFKFSLYPENTGKTVARNVKINIENISAMAEFAENSHAIRMTQDQLFRQQGTNKRATLPDTPGPQDLAPGQTALVPIYTAGQEPKSFGKSSMVTIILGRIDYMDAFKVRHYMRFCYVIANAKGELYHCKYGNDDDNNLAEHR